MEEGFIAKQKGASHRAGKSVEFRNVKALYSSNLFPPLRERIVDTAMLKSCSDALNPYISIFI